MRRSTFRIGLASVVARNAQAMLGGASGPPTLGLLSLSPPIRNGVPASCVITGASTGTVIVSNVTGLTVNNTLRTATWDGTGAAGATANGLVETLAGAIGSPRSSPITVLAALPALSGTGAGLVTVTGGGAGTISTPATLSGSGAGGVSITATGSGALVINLGALMLSAPLTIGTPSSGTITGATPGSTITSNLSYLTVNSAARTYSYDGTDPNALPSNYDVLILGGGQSNFIGNGSMSTLTPTSARRNYVNGDATSGAGTAPVVPVYQAARAAGPSFTWADYILAANGETISGQAGPLIESAVNTVPSSGLGDAGGLTIGIAERAYAGQAFTAANQLRLWKSGRQGQRIEQFLPYVDNTVTYSNIYKGEQEAVVALLRPYVAAAARPIYVPCTIWWQGEAQATDASNGAGASDPAITEYAGELDQVWAQQEAWLGIKPPRFVINLVKNITPPYTALIADILKAKCRWTATIATDGTLTGVIDNGTGDPLRWLVDHSFGPTLHINMAQQRLLGLGVTALLASIHGSYCISTNYRVTKIAPVWSIKPTLVAASQTTVGASFTFRPAETGTVFYAGVESGAAAPTAAQIVAGTGGGIVFAGNLAATKETTATRVMTGAAGGTAYDVYVVLRDAAATVTSALASFGFVSAIGALTGTGAGAAGAGGAGSGSSQPVITGTGGGAAGAGGSGSGNIVVPVTGSGGGSTPAVGGAGSGTIAAAPSGAGAGAASAAGAGSGSKLWEPASATWWYDFSDTSTITASSGNVSSVADKSGNGNTLTALGTAGFLRTGATTLNGLNVIDSDGGSGSTTPGLVKSTSTTIPASWYIQLVVSITTVNGADNVFMLDTNGETVGFAFGGASGSAFTARINKTNNSLNPGTDYLGTGWHIFGIRYDASTKNLSLWVDGTQVAQKVPLSTSGVMTTTPAAIRFLRNTTVTGPTGSMASSMMVPLADQTNAEGRAAWRFGLVSKLPSGHAYKNGPPV